VTMAPRREVMALLEAVKDDPESDAPRLVLADWLEEHGDEADLARAEYVRLECLPSPEGKKRSEALWQRHQAAWRGPVAALLNAGKGKASLHRGTRGLLDLFGDARTLAAKKYAPLAGSEEFAWIDKLWLQSGSPATREKVLESPLLDGLNHLVLDGVEVRPRGAQALLETRRLSRLHSLILEGCSVEAEGVKLLARAPLMKSLRKLNLRRNLIWPESVAVLARSPYLRQLRELNLSSHDLQDGAGALAEARWLGSLEHLDLSETTTCDLAVRAIARSPRVNGLRVLNLRQNKLTAKGVSALAQSSHLNRLGLLDLSHNPLDDEGAFALAEGPLLARLHLLGLARVGLGVRAVRALIASSHWGALRELHLHGNSIGDAGAAALAEAVGREPLFHAGLGDCGIGDAGALALADALASGRIGGADLAWNRAISGGVRAELRRRFGHRVSLGT
jgi:uncharacterized protein (TIGR02996 family)